MIRVTVELYPGGDACRARTLAMAEIVNDGTGTKTCGNYKVAILRVVDPLDPNKRPAVARRGRVDNYPRLDKSVWELVRLAIEATRPKRGKRWRL